MLAQLCVILIASSWPSRWTPDQVQTANKIVAFSEMHNLDSKEMVAIAWIETRLRPQAISPTRDFGLFQINCRVWHDRLGYPNIEDCYLGMLDYQTNIEAAAFILILYRGKYRQCRGSKVYMCYNGGPGYSRSKNIEKIKRYRRRVRLIKRQMRRWIYFKSLTAESSKVSSLEITTNSFSVMIT